MRTLLSEELAGIFSKKHALPRNLLIQSFLPRIINSPPKVALFDPVLMRLQALNESNLAKVMSAIGHFAIALVRQCLDAHRFQKFVKNKYPSIDFSRHYSQAGENPFSHQSLRSALLRRIISNNTRALLELSLIHI